MFAGRSSNAVNKRLRKLCDGGWLYTARVHRMQAAFYRLGHRGRTLVEESLGRAVTINWRLPAHLNHFSQINDVRIWLVQSGENHVYQIQSFIGEWDMKRLRQRWSLIPDAIAVLSTPDGRRRL